MQWTHRESPQNLKSSYYGPKSILDFSPTNSSHGNSKYAQLLQFSPFLCGHRCTNVITTTNDKYRKYRNSYTKFYKRTAQNYGNIRSDRLFKQRKMNQKSYVPDQLQTCDKVWIRIDRVRKPLEAPYSGPYMVLERTPKYFLIETNSNTHTQGSIDRLKPYIENKQKCTQNGTTNTNKKSESLPPEKVQEHKMKTRTSGRTVTWKKDNEYIYY